MPEGRGFHRAITMTTASKKPSLPGMLAGSGDQPILWALGVTVVVGAAIAAGLAALVIPPVIVIALFVGAYLSSMLLFGPLVLILKTVVAVGLLTIIGGVLATLAIGNAWLSALLVAAMAFLGTLWTALPLVGPLAAGMPTMLVLVIVIQGNGVTAGQPWSGVVLAVVCGLVAIVILALLIHARDPRGVSRKKVANCWDPETPISEIGNTAQILRLDNAGDRYFGLLTLAAYTKIARSIALRAKQPVPQEKQDSLDAYATEVGSTLSKRGHLEPRSIAAPQFPDATDLTGAAAFGVNDQKAALTRAYEFLTTGAKLPSRRTSPPGLPALLWQLLRSPDSTSFRFGIQHAIGLGIGTLILLLADVFAESAFWVLLTMFLVLQRNATATLTKTVQRVVGTLIGALGAATAALVIPADVLFPWVAIVVILVGFAFIQRNYTVMAGAFAALMVLALGSPTEDFWTWAILRFLDTVIGAAIAFGVSHLILPNKPQMRARFDSVVTILESITDHLRDSISAGQSARWGQQQIRLSIAVSNYESDAAMLDDRASKEVEAATQALRDQIDRINAMVLVSNHSADAMSDRSQVLAKGLDLITNSFAELQEVGKSLPTG